MSHCRDQAVTLTRRLMAMIVRSDFTMDKMEDVLETEIFNAEQRGRLLAGNAQQDHTKEVTKTLGGVPSERELRLSATDGELEIAARAIVGTHPSTKKEIIPDITEPYGPTRYGGNFSPQKHFEKDGTPKHEGANLPLVPTRDDYEDDDNERRVGDQDSDLPL